MDIKLNQGDYKSPGLKLVENLQENNIFKLIDFPATPRYMGILRFLKVYFKNLRIILKNLNNNFTFYNLSIAYIPVYLLILISGKKSNLLLADGENCILYKKFGYLYKYFFNKIIYLSYILHTKNHLNSLWFPGVSFEYVNDMKNYTYDIIYNSSFKNANDPSKLLEFASINKHLNIIITGSRDDFITYLSNCSNQFIPDNVHFSGKLSYPDYLKLLDKVRSVLLIRNEELFENITNFPSKFIEALNKNKTVICIGKISGVNPSLYIRLENCVYINSVDESYLNNKKDDIQFFLNKCNPKIIKDFLN